MSTKLNLSAKREQDCGTNKGSLPSCAPLAVPFVPMQENNPQTYDAAMALTRGTLFPGLDLPFKNIVNKSHPYAGTPLGEIMALSFMIKELQLYLDTHCDDTEAFEMLKDVIKLYEDGSRKFVKLYGPMNITDVQYSDCYSWLNGPWPWEYAERPGTN